MRFIPARHCVLGTKAALKERASKGAATVEETQRAARTTMNAFIMIGLKMGELLILIRRVVN